MPDNNENIAVATDNLKCRILLQQALERCSENIFFADTCDKLKELFNGTAKITAVLIEASFCDSDWKTIADKLKTAETSLSYCFPIQKTCLKKKAMNRQTAF